MDYVATLDERGVQLVTTTEHVREMRRKLVDVFDMTESDAADEVGRVVGFFELVDVVAFQHMQPYAEARLGQGGKSDWPTLAAAMAFEASIWSDDRDFFGVGIPVWSTHNVQFAEGRA
jgi:predicted nucleic acid-binding protein